MNLVNETGKPRLLGFLLADGTRNVKPTLVPVNGMTVLYGLNGAGKTRSLEAIRDFFSGRGGALPMALIQLGSANCDAHRTWAPDWARGAERLPKDYWSAVESESALCRWVEHQIDYDADEAVMPGSGSSSRASGLLDEWFTQRLVLVTSVGTEMAPRWLSWPAIVTRSDTPFSNREAEFEATIDDDFEDWHVCTYVTDGRLPNGSAILGAAPRGTTALDMPWSYGAQHEELLDLGIQLASEFDDLEETTRRVMVRAANGDEVRVCDGTVMPSEWLEELRRQLVQKANATYAGVLLDAPRLQLDLTVVGLGAGVSWSVESDHAGSHRRRRDLARLSSAQRRWARWAILSAIADLANDGETATLSLIDEPEAALHRSAEAHMAAFIATAASPLSRFVVATHSPELLDSRRADVIEVTRRAGRYHHAPLTDVDLGAMESLGLTPSDLLRRQRGFLLVEGQHDQDVLQILLGDELRRLRVDVLPLRGATELSAPRSRFLFRYTSAHVFVVLDNLKSEDVSVGWEEVRRAFLAEGLDAARAALAKQFPKDLFGKGTEVNALSEFLSACLDHGTWDRVTPFGLTRGDIVEYLPVRKFVPGKLDWDQLRAAFDAELAAGTTKVKNFKRWLPTRGGRVTDEAVREAAGSLDYIPKDFERLRKTIEAVTNQA